MISFMLMFIVTFSFLTLASSTFLPDFFLDDGLAMLNESPLLSPHPILSSFATSPHPILSSFATHLDKMVGLGEKNIFREEAFPNQIIINNHHWPNADQLILPSLKNLISSPATIPSTLDSEISSYIRGLSGISPNNPLFQYRPNYYDYPMPISNFVDQNIGSIPQKQNYNAHSSPFLNALAQNNGLDQNKKRYNLYPKSSSNVVTPNNAIIPNKQNYNILPASDTNTITSNNAMIQQKHNYNAYPSSKSNIITPNSAINQNKQNYNPIRSSSSNAIAPNDAALTFKKNFNSGPSSSSSPIFSLNRPFNMCLAQKLKRIALPSYVQ